MHAREFANEEEKKKETKSLLPECVVTKNSNA